MNKWRVPLGGKGVRKIEGGHALPGEKKKKKGTKNKEKSRYDSRPIARGVPSLNPEAATRKRGVFPSVSRPRFISGGSVSEARLGVKCLQVV